MEENLDNTAQSVSGTNPQKGNYLHDILLPSVVILAVILAGIGTGWMLRTVFSGGQISEKDTSLAAVPGVKVSEGGKEVGLENESTFRDTAEGVLEEGGFEGEGTYHLVRDGGPSQYVYLTSSVIDLSQFVGKKVQVWGETVAPQKVGWLMDVGKIRILE